MKHINWGALITALGLLGGMAVFYDCTPVVKSQLAPMIQKSNMIHDALYRNQVSTHEDIKRIMNKLDVPHHNDDMVEPEELETHHMAPGDAMAAEPAQ